MAGNSGNGLNTWGVKEEWAQGRTKWKRQQNPPAHTRRRRGKVRILTTN